MLFRSLLVLLFTWNTVTGFCYYGTAFKNVTGCFQFFRTPLNFTNAVRFCRVNLKSTIGRPTSFEKNRQIQEAAAKLGIEEYWIGATNVDNDWEWLDGSMMTYSNFDVAAGYPKKTESQVGAVSMESLFGLWYTKIDAMALPFVCEFQATEDYSQGVLYRVPKTQSLRFPHGGIKAPIVLVQSADQSVLYPAVGPIQNEVDTGEKAYMEPINMTAGAFPSMGLSGQPVVILNPRRVRVKLKPVVVTETETEQNRSVKEKEETEDSVNVKSSQQATGASGNGTALAEELNSNSKAKREREESETLRTKITNIQRG
ncbi:unnamed protein product [Caenorhabditis sp. 36 PRJEB53466]|nr:unnamed protein product [Caenorhabditis sp. 36 PRJEB53466]